VISARIFHGWRIVAAGFVLETLILPGFVAP
jgi:hypothetical protein